MKVRGIGKIVVSEGVDGPGARAVVHFAGCTVGCAGCFNPHTHGFTGPDVWTRDVESLADDMLALSRAVTISGGEPTDQPFALLSLLKALRAKGCDDIVFYTGRRVEELRDHGWARAALWSNIEGHGLADVVIDGPFVRAKLEQDGGLTRGSTNQRVICLTDRWTEDDFRSRETQIEIGEDGQIVVTGFPSGELQDTLRSMAG